MSRKSAVSQGPLKDKSVHDLRLKKTYQDQQDVAESLLGNGKKTAPEMSFLQRLNTYFGKRLLFILWCVYFGIKGFAFASLTTFMLPYFKSHGVTGAKFQLYSALASIPWSIKPIFGFISDLYPLGGYHKRFYIILGLILGSCSTAVIALVHFSPENIYASVFLFFCCMCEFAICDLLVEAKYTEIMRENPQTKGDVVSYTWGNNKIGTLLGVTLMGLLTKDGVDVNPNIWLIFPFQIIAMLPFLLGFLDESYIANPRFIIEKYREQKSLMNLSLGFSIIALGLVFVNVFLSDFWKTVYSTAVLFVIIGGFNMCLPKILARYLTYSFLHNALQLSVGGGLTYFYLADDKCVPGGPHFSYEFYQVWSSFVSLFGTFCGLFLFQWYMSNWKVRNQLWIPLILAGLSSVFDIVQVMRWNLAIGMPDVVFFLFGDNVIQPILSMLVFLPGMVLVSKFCPPAYESTVFALSASTSNFGGAMAGVWGSYMLNWFDVRTTAPCNFDNLPLLIIIGKILVPLVLLPLTFILIPDITLDENVDYSEFAEEDSDDSGMSLISENRYNLRP